jgi:zinc protease
MPATQRSAPPPLVFKEIAGPSVFLSDKDITQANIILSQPFVKRPHPDYYPAAVASYILGGGSFSSRLMATVRAKEGLAYSVYSFTDSDYENVGITGVALQTKVESADTALALIKSVIDSLAQFGPTDEELAGAKKSLIESIPSMFDTPQNTASAFAVSELWGRGLDHYVQYPVKVNAVTKEQVRAMVAQYFNWNKMRISIVGPAQKLDLKRWGNVTLVPVDSLDF